MASSVNGDLPLEESAPNEFSYRVWWWKSTDSQPEDYTSAIYKSEYTGERLSLLVENLDHSTDYYFVVEKVYKQFVSRSKTETYKTQGLPKGPVIAVSDVTSTSARVSWSTDDMGSISIQAYEIIGTGQITLDHTVASDVREMALTGLPSSTRINVTVVAIPTDANLPGLSSASITFTTYGYVAPVLSCVRRHPDGVDVKWTQAKASGAGATIDGYVICSFDEKKNKTALSPIIPVETMGYFVNIKPNAAIELVVETKLSGTSQLSSSVCSNSIIVKTAKPPIAPSGFITARSKDSITLSWLPVTEKSGAAAAASYYSVEIDGKEFMSNLGLHETTHSLSRKHIERFTSKSSGGYAAIIVAHSSETDVWSASHPIAIAFLSDADSYFELRNTSAASENGDVMKG